MDAATPDPALIETLLEALGLKRLPRAGWLRHGVEHPESVAAHSWGVAWLALVLAPPELDRARLLTYATLHDLPEVRVGDLTPADAVPASDKAQREHHAMAGLSAGLPGGDALLAAFVAYERQQDPEARFVRQLDRLDMALQAVAYSADTGGQLAEFLDSAAQVITEPALVALLDALRGRLAGALS